MVGTSGLIEKIPATEEWTYVVLISCIGVFITTPIFVYIMICVSKQTKASRWILGSTFGYLISLFIYSLSQFLIFNPHRWDIEPSEAICNYIKKPEVAVIAFAHFCFYEFCILRINIIFAVTSNLRLPMYQFIIMQILIFGYLLYGCIILPFVLAKVQFHPTLGFCYAAQDHADVHVGILVVWDTVIVFVLSAMFSIKIIHGGCRRDTQFQQFAAKTSVLGLISTSSSLMVTFFFFLGRMNRFVLVTDGLLNSMCIVFSFNMNYVTVPNVKCKCKCSCKQHDITKVHSGTNSEANSLKTDEEDERRETCVETGENITESLLVTDELEAESDTEVVDDNNAE
eukprot:4312_1